MNPFLRRKTENAIGGPSNQPPIPSAAPSLPSPMIPPTPTMTPFVPTQNAYSAPPPMAPPTAPPPPVDTNVTSAPTYSSYGNRHGMTASALYKQVQQPVSPPVDSTAAAVSEPDYTPAPVYNLPEPAAVPPEQRVSGSSIPHPTAFFEAPIQVAADDTSRPLPLAGDPVTIFEGTNSSPAFMRPTTSVLAEERSMMNTILSGKDPSFCSGLGIVITPFAKNTEILQTNRSTGIPRCSNCRGYINCYSQFINYGNSFICNLCGTQNELPEYYRSGLDPQNKPLDIAEKPELQRGSYEAIVDPQAFNMKPAESPVFVFLLDTSVQAINTGLLSTAIQAIKASLQILADKQNDTRVGFVTMDVRSKFVSLQNGHVKETICADYEESFGCIPPFKWLTSVNEETLPDLIKVLDFIHGTATAATSATHSVLIATIKAVASILQQTGGRMVVVQSNQGYGEGSPQIREGIKVYGTTEEMNLYNRSVDNAILQNILNMCLNASISIDLIAAGGAQTFFALNILESVITNLGGTIYYKSTLTGPYRDNTLAEIHAYMQVLVINNTYRSISARLRLSEGLSVSHYYGGLTNNDNNCYCSSCATSESTVVAEIQMDRYLKGSQAFAQYAVLYNNDQNQCCIRVFNYCFKVSTDYRSVYHSIDFSAYFLLLTRCAVALIEEEGVYKTREKLTEVTATLLANYRNNCCQKSPNSQLSLPESLSLLPLYFNSLLKSSLLSMAQMNTVSRLEDVYPRADERVYAKWLCFNCTLEKVLDFVYPHLYQLSEADPAWGVEHEQYITLPARLPLSGSALSHDGIFLLTGVEGLCIVVGKTILPEVCQRVFNTSAIVNAVHASTLSVLDYEDPFVIRINSVLYSLREMYGEHLQVRIVLRGENEMNEVSRSFRDDRCGNDPSLSEFVCTFYKKVIEKYKWDVC